MHLLKKIRNAVLIILAVAIAAAGCFIGWLAVTEYKPEQTEELAVESTSANTEARTLKTDDTLRIVTMNIGFAALDKDQDFFMDGGQMSVTSSAERVVETTDAIIELINGLNADAVMMQEIDVNSRRSYNYNEYAEMTSENGLKKTNSAFAINFKCEYVPYPLKGMLGKVHSGIATFTDFKVESAVREALPIPFKWPVSMANLKRCLLVERIPVEGTDRQLVLINLHLEAYDDGEGKTAQTAVLVQLMKEEYEKGNYVIAGGDFNQSFKGIDADKYAVKNPDLWAPADMDLSGLSSEWQTAYDDSVPTSRLLNQPYDPESAETQYYVIDGFILSPNVTVEAVETVDAGFEYSDHNPVVLDVKLAE